MSYCKWFVQDDQKLGLLQGTLVDQFEKKQLALTTTETSSEFSCHGSSHLDLISGAFIDVDVPIRETGRIKIGYLGDSHIGTDGMVLS